MAGGWNGDRGTPHRVVIDYARYLVDMSVSMLHNHATILGGCSQRQRSREEGSLAMQVGHILKQTGLTYSIVLTGLLYLARFHKRSTRSEAAKKIKSLYVLFVLTMMLANKFLCDRPISNYGWSKYARLHPATINRQEVSFLKTIDYELHVDAFYFQQWVRHLLAPTRLSHYQMRLPPTPVYELEEPKGEGAGRKRVRLLK